MKCAITGHTRGLGKYFFDHFTNAGYECLGFSRMTGYDIGKDRAAIVDQCRGVDVFINNACNKDMSQIQLMIDMMYECKHMVVCGSVSADFPEIFGDDNYVKGKQVLSEACRYLTALADENIAKILYLDLCFLNHSVINPDNPKDFGSDWGVSARDVVSAVDYWLTNPWITRIEWNQKMTPFLEKELLRTYPETSVSTMSVIKDKINQYLNYNK